MAIEEKCNLSWNQAGWFEVTNQIPEFAKNTVWPTKLVLNTIEPSQVEDSYVLRFAFELHRVARIHPNTFNLEPLKLPPLQVENKDIDAILKLCYALDDGFELNWNKLIPVAVRMSYGVTNLRYDGATGEIINWQGAMVNALQTGRVLNARG